MKDFEFEKYVATITGADGNELNVGNYYIYDSNASKGFNFGYMLYIPNNVRLNSALIVEGANTGTTSISLKQGIKDIQNQVFKFSTIGQYLAYKLNIPFMIPLIPRISLKDHDLYTHMLTSEVLNLKDGPFQKIDIQLIKMIEDVKQKLSEMNINVDEKIILNGFSASAKFVNRFTLLHPEIVKLCLAGGVSGCLTLPLKEINNEKINFPIGMGDISEFSDETFSVFQEIPQFYYMGDLDNKNDPYAHCNSNINIPKYKSIITEKELKQVHNILGIDMQHERWNNTQKIYRKLGINAKFKTYKGYGHTPQPAYGDLIEIIEENLRINKDNTRKL